MYRENVFKYRKTIFLSYGAALQPCSNITETTGNSTASIASVQQYMHVFDPINILDQFLDFVCFATLHTP